MATVIEPTIFELSSPGRRGVTMPASDVPITQTFGPNTLVSFKVWTDEIP